ncbi:MAG: AAA family ATPase [Planctomycetota bacterium]|nr:MAG: AAA family ATPase [Planctomycetota bacterium]
MTPEKFYENFNLIREEIAKVVVGQEVAIEQLLAGFFAEGHLLLTGLPGLGRTLIVKTLAEIMNLDYNRLQFTPDLLPTDIIGSEILVSDKFGGDRSFKFYKGPIFANLVLADELNRSPARTQSALLEVMQEHQVTVGGKTYYLPKPFSLIATLNSLDTEGVWDLGEAQADRFMMSIPLEYPDEDEEREIIEKTTGFGRHKVKAVTDPETVLAMQQLAKSVPVIPSVQKFAMSIVRLTRPEEAECPAEVKRTVRLGASTRAVQSLIRGSKVLALARGRQYVTRQDIEFLMGPVLNHRLLLDYRAQAFGYDIEDVLKAVCKAAWERSLPSVSKWTNQILKGKSE